VDVLPLTPTVVEAITLVRVLVIQLADIQYSIVQFLRVLAIVLVLVVRVVVIMLLRGVVVIAQVEDMEVFL
jgi:hypothetical protein